MNLATEHESALYSLCVCVCGWCVSAWLCV